MEKLKSREANYFRVMGCVACLVTLAMFVGMIIGLVQLFSSGSAAWPIVATFLNLIAVATLGSGITNLFFSHACVIDNNYDCDCDVEY